MNADSTPPSTTILRFAYLPRDAAGFIIPVLTRLRSSTVPHLARLNAEWDNSENAADAIAITTKLAMLGIVVTRLNEDIAQLAQELNARSEVEVHLALGLGWQPRDKALPYRVLVDVDSFLFEFRSCYELLGRLIPRLMKAIADRQLVERDILDRLVAEGIDTSWTTTLREHRKLYFHEVAPWFVARDPLAAPGTRELIFIEGPRGDPEGGLSLDEIGLIHRGLLQATTAFQRWLIEEIEKAEQPRPGR